MPTGYHAARVANVQKGDKVVVIGDGAVGQCAVIASKMRGASQIVLMSRHEDRQKMALESGATAVVAERGEKGIDKVREILGGGADAALECVGTEAAVEQALGALHNGGRMGFVGVPHYNNRSLGSTFAQNILVAGGVASVTTYDKQVLLKAVLDGDINPGRVFTTSYKLEDINQAYKDMDERKSIKSMIVLDQLSYTKVLVMQESCVSKPFYMLQRRQKMITVERASHTDLYDQVNVIPFEEMDRFIKENM